MTFSDHGIGIIVTVSVLVAAGVAAYQSPQVQHWVSNSRRKISVALHNLGDEIHPRDAVREDISMLEEVGEAAEERRRSARAEIMRRANLLESRKTARDPQLPLNSFDTLVDNDGNLRFAKDEHGSSTGIPTANSTGLDIDGAQPLRRGVNPNNVGPAAMNEALPRLHIPSAATSNRTSGSIIQLTPTSEQSGEHGLFDPFSDSPVNGQSPVSATASSHTEGHTIFYAHPHSTSNFSNQQETGLSRAEMSEFDRGSHYQYGGSSAQSAPGSDSQIGPQQWIDSLHVGLDELDPANISRHGGSSAQSTTGSDVQSDGFDIPSNGTLSDLGVRSVGGSSTAGNWSEVGSVVSNDDAGHRSLI